MELDIYREANSIEVTESDLANYKIIFGKAVKKLRLLMRFSVEEVSEFSGLTKNMVTKLENGTSSSEAFYNFAMQLLGFYRENVYKIFSEGELYLDWLFIDGNLYKPKILKNYDRFLKFLDTKVIFCSQHVNCVEN
jgi:transcriptional regulator with XRE-family HTH domain